MNIYQSDGKKLLNVEYDVTPEINDMIDDMRVISKDVRDEEYAVFMVDQYRRICCYVFDEIFIIGKVDGFETLPQAVEAWRDGEI